MFRFLCWPIIIFHCFSLLLSFLAQELVSFRGFMFLPSTPVWKYLSHIDWRPAQCTNKVHATGRKHCCFIIVLQIRRPRICVRYFGVFRADFAHCSSRIRLDAVITEVVIERWADSGCVPVRFLLVYGRSCWKQANLKCQFKLPCRWWALSGSCEEDRSKKQHYEKRV